MSPVPPITSQSNPVPAETDSQQHGAGNRKPRHPEKCPLWLHVVAFAVIFIPYLFN